VDDRDEGPIGPGEPSGFAGEDEATDARSGELAEPARRPAQGAGSQRADGDAPSHEEPDRAAGPVTEGLRIAAVEAAVAAGLAPASGRRLDASGTTRDEEAPAAESFSALELPDWSDPPTGQVPRILLDADDTGEGDEGPAMRGPTWREERSDWEQDLDLSFLVEDGTPSGIAGHASEVPREDDPFDFSFEELDTVARTRRSEPPAAGGDDESAREPRHLASGDAVAPSAERHGESPSAQRDEDGIDDDAWAALLDPVAAVGEDGIGRTVARRARRRARHRAGTPTHGRAAEHSREAADGEERPEATPAGEAGSRSAAFAGEPAASWLRRDRRPRRPRPEAPSEVAGEAPAPESGGRRSPLLATVTGVVAGGIAIGCFEAGAVASLALVTVLVTLAAGEAFGALRRGGLQPATLLGLVAVPFLVVGTYLHGASAIPVVLGITVLAAFVWYLAEGLLASEGSHHPVTNLGGTLLVICWVGFLGSFAGLLLAPSAFPHRHGVALLAAVAALTVASDVGAYATGARFGKHLLAPRISPHKSWEGFLGGTVLTLAVAALVVSRIHPITMSHALLLGLVVVVIAPIGDLAESLVKRDIGVKDMGSLLPAHGGVLDRVDAMLFVLPVAYYVVRLVHIS
jgi:CDP-diglyceride synthetase